MWCFEFAWVLLLSFMGFQDGPFKSQLVEHIGCLIGPFYARDHLCYILAGPLGIKIALPDYKDCIWVTLHSRGSIGYQDGPFDQRLLSVYVAFLSWSSTNWDRRRHLALLSWWTEDRCWDDGNLCKPICNLWSYSPNPSSPPLVKISLTWITHPNHQQH